MAFCLPPLLQPQQSAGTKAQSESTLQADLFLFSARAGPATDMTNATAAQKTMRMGSHYSAIRHTRLVVSGENCWIFHLTRSTMKGLFRFGP
jgi:hypothetical protein